MSILNYICAVLWALVALAIGFNFIEMDKTGAILACIIIVMDSVILGNFERAKKIKAK